MTKLIDEAKTIVHSIRLVLEEGDVVDLEKMLVEAGKFIEQLEKQSEWISVDKLFLTSWPCGRLRPVKTLGEHPTIEDGIYIRYLDSKGGTDTTTDEFLFDLPTPPIKGDV